MVHYVSARSRAYSHLTEVSPIWGCESPGEKKQQKQKAQDSPSHVHVCIAAMLEPHAHLRLSNGSYSQSYRAAWHPGWVQAGPRVGPCNRPHSGAGALLNPRETSQDSALLQNGLQLCNTKSSLCEACGDHPQSTESSVFSLHKGSFMASACFILWDRTPTPLLRCSLPIIIIQLEFVSFKHRKFEHPLSRILVSQSLLPGLPSPTTVWGEPAAISPGQVSLRRGAISEAMALPLHRAGQPPSEETHWAQHTGGVFWLCLRQDFVF